MSLQRWNNPGKPCKGSPTKSSQLVLGLKNRPAEPCISRSRPDETISDEDREHKLMVMNQLRGHPRRDPRKTKRGIRQDIPATGSMRGYDNDHTYMKGKCFSSLFLLDSGLSEVDDAYIDVDPFFKSGS